MNKVAVLGAGMVGSAIALDLGLDFDVTVFDNDLNKLNKLKEKGTLKTLPIDIKDKLTLITELAKFEAVICAVPGFMGYETLKTVIESGKDVVDISFFPEDPFQLDDLAKEKNVTAIIDCGVAPGMFNIILGHYNTMMEIDEFTCLVGGLPIKRNWPYQYKAPFSPTDVIEIYTRPVRLVENGRVVTKEALSDPEFIDFDEVGTLEAFNSDGLRTLLTTISIPYMKEKTLRYPGHIEYIRVLRDSGFFSDEPIEVDGNKICPVDLTEKLLFPKWKLEENEAEFTIMRIIIRGIEPIHSATGGEQNKKIQYTYNLFDKFDEKTKTSSMARTTGYTCTAAARLLFNGKFSRKGICPPEYLGENEDCFNFVMDELKKRNINYKLIKMDY